MRNIRAENAEFHDPRREAFFLPLHSGLRRQIAWPSFLGPAGTMETPHLLLLKQLAADVTQPA